MESFVVKKLGWENAAEMLKSAGNVIDGAKVWVKQAVVISAMRSSEFNTTDKLIKIWNAINTEDFHQADTLIKEIWDFHRAIIKERVWSVQRVYEEADEILEGEIRNFWNIVRYAFERKKKVSKDNDYTVLDKDWNPHSIIGFWEVLSARIFSTVINEFSKLESQEIKSSVINTSNAIWDILNRNAFMSLAHSLQKKVQENQSISIVPGYVGGFKWGIELAVGRGYSDATAAALAVGMKKSWYAEVILEIQKFVIGMLSSNPQFIPIELLSLIKKLSYTIAREITGWAEAKLLHNQALRKELQEAWIIVKLFHPFDTRYSGTLISNEKSDQPWILFVDGKDVTTFNISSPYMEEVWILETIFSIAKKYWSIDIVTTSETEVSATFDIDSLPEEKKTQFIDEIRTALNMEENSDVNYIKYREDLSLIFCIGENIKDRVWTLHEITQVLKDNK